MINILFIYSASWQQSDCSCKEPIEPCTLPIYLEGAWIDFNQYIQFETDNAWGEPTASGPFTIQPNSKGSFRLGCWLFWERWVEK